VEWLRLRYLNNDFPAAEALLDQLEQQSPADTDLLLWRVRLHIEAWRLDAADSLLTEIARQQVVAVEPILIRGRIQLLRKEYDNALHTAAKAQQLDEQSADACLLEAEAWLWKEDLAQAEAALVRCLRLNPLHADARFYYGYTIWRRRDASQLPAMAAQWELALAIHPLHYLTHWHWGNGHTHLTYVDYTEPDDSLVRAALALIEKQISENQLPAALIAIRSVAARYPGSVLPDMMAGSVWYMAFDQGVSRLDSAEQIFAAILQRKAHYGPAHNGLAAVIKARRFTYLAAFDSLDQQINQTVIQRESAFTQVFPDVRYYPGNQVQKMVYAQVYTSTAYFAMLAKMNRKFVIPPLHRDLTTAMGNSYFRRATTFDNRQWMDIRGVGSGAAGIEYVLRGAFLERNVVLHEYVHLFHSSVFTEAETRRVRTLYYQAMSEARTLDYYSRNNEFEYLAQTYPAYFEPVKVHPLNHKSVNTTTDLKTKDPALYAFLDSLVQKQRAFLAGDTARMSDNWAQVYVNLAEKEMRRNPSLAAACLDTALRFADYLPAIRAYARLEMARGRGQEVARWMASARRLAPKDPGTDLLAAEWAHRQKEPLAAEIPFYEQAWANETDFMERADINQRWRSRYAEEALLGEAVAKAMEYADQAPVVSTYLLDRRDEALAFAWELKGNWGYEAEAMDFFQELCTRKPQDFAFATTYARLLMRSGQYEQAYQWMESRQQILAAAGTRSPALDVLILKALVQMGRAGEVVTKMQNQDLTRLKNSSFLEKMEQVDLLITTGNPEKAQFLWARSRPANRWEQGEWRFAEARIQISNGNLKKAHALLRRVLELNPYHVEARLRLLNEVDSQADRNALRHSIPDAMPPGPGWADILDDYK
jgi:hypothetical protein